MQIREDDLTGDIIAAFLQEHLDEMHQVTPAESVHALDLEALRSPYITFWSVWEGDQLRGCGALKQLDAHTGEIKSMRTDRAYRGQGIASRLLAHIIQEAQRRNYHWLHLETGAQPAFAPARALYARFGFKYREPFADYTDDPNSVFMTKSLAVEAAELAVWVNGDRLRLSAESLAQSLLEFLRQSGRVGTKEGCGDGDCGACTVAILDQGAEGQPQYQAVNSCLVPLGAVVGREVVTVEGIGRGQLHPVQAAMVETGGSQCGYCTPGFIMSLFAAYYDGALSDTSVEGNLCRCTGYLAIRRAVQQLVGAGQSPSAEGMAGDRSSNGRATNGHSPSAAVGSATPPRAAGLTEPKTLPEEGDRFYARLTQPLPPLAGYQSQTSGQQFYRPTRLPEVLALLQQYPHATLVAGATDLGLELSHHRKSFPVLISLEAVRELRQLQHTSDQVEIGAAVPLSQLETALRGAFPALDEMLFWFAARQVRNRATLGGNLGTASPIGDLPPVLLALEAQLQLASVAGRRIVPVASFFKDYRVTDLQPGELIVSVQIPKRLPPGATRRLSQSYKVGKRGTDDISIVAAAFVVDLDAEQQVVQARLAYGGVAATPVRAIAVEQLLQHQPWTQATIQRAKEALHDAFTPLSDLRASADYRRMLVANLFEKFFVEHS